MMKSSTGVMLVLGSIVLCGVRVVSASQVCYSEAGIAGIVFATMFATIVATIIAFLAYHFVWKPRRKEKAGNKLEVVEEGNDKFAYDNPYFQEEDVEKKNAILRNDSDSSIKKDPPPQIESLEKSETLKNGKVGPFSNVVFTNPGNKPKTLDDSFISLEPEIINVPLRGHDFSGLGFNITGNMRDGIFVKDVLHRGPASESGQLKIGDRILSVTVSFSSMVYEDALTILSYASPYDVSLQLKKAGRSNLAGHEKKASMSSNDIMTFGNGLSSSSDRLYHPLYRSKSIDDLTQIGKDQLTGGLAMNGGIPPRRSLSIGTPVHRLRRDKTQNKEKLPDKAESPVSILKPKADTAPDTRRSSGKSSASSDSSKSAGEEPKESIVQIVPSDVVITMDREDEKTQTKDQDAASVVEITGDPDKSSVIVKTGSGPDIVEAIDVPKEETRIDIPGPGGETVVVISGDERAEQPDKKARKKGKAPPPPPAPHVEQDVEEKRPSSRSSSSSNDEDVSFRDAKDTSNVEDPSLITAQDVSFEPDSLEKTYYLPAVSTLSRKSSSSSVSEDSLERTDSLNRKSNSHKSSSLGDISKAEVVVSGTDSLERATSLDLKKDPVPEGILGEQNKHLKRRAPNPPPSSSSSSDDTLPSDQQLTTDVSIGPPAGLVYEASDAVEDDSLEKISLKDEKEETADPDSLEIEFRPGDVEGDEYVPGDMEIEFVSSDEEIEFVPGEVQASASPTAHVIPKTEPEERSRKSSTSSDSSAEAEKPDAEENITKVRVSVPSDFLSKLDAYCSSPSDEESEKTVTPDKAPSRKSSSSSASSDCNEKGAKVERKSSTSSTSSGSSKEAAEEDRKFTPRKSSTSSVSSVEVEETIVRSTRKTIQVEAFPQLDDSSDNECAEEDPEQKQQPERKVLSADDLKMDTTMSSSDESESSVTEYSINVTPPPPPLLPAAEETPITAPMEPVSDPPEVKAAITKSNSDLPVLNLPIIPPLIITANKVATPSGGDDDDSAPKAEVIEITQQELDDVMMTHEQFMRKQALKQKEPTIVQGGRDMSFEDWSLRSGVGDAGTVNGNTTYSSSFETNISIDGLSSEVVKIVTSSSSSTADQGPDPAMPELKSLE